MYTYRITNDENGIMVWIDQDGQPIIMQPHHHNALNNAPWESEAEAETWAIEALERLQQEGTESFSGSSSRSRSSKIN